MKITSSKPFMTAQQEQIFINALCNGYVKDVAKMLKKLLKKGWNINQSLTSPTNPTIRRTALHYAVCCSTHPSVTTRLLSLFFEQENLEVDIKDARGVTPLFLAARSNNLKAMEMLIEKGANYKLTFQYNGDIWWTFLDFIECRYARNQMKYFLKKFEEKQAAALLHEQYPAGLEPIVKDNYPLQNESAHSSGCRKSFTSKISSFFKKQKSNTHSIETEVPYIKLSK